MSEQNSCAKTTIPRRGTSGLPDSTMPVRRRPSKALKVTGSPVRRSKSSGLRANGGRVVRMMFSAMRTYFRITIVPTRHNAAAVRTIVTSAQLREKTSRSDNASTSQALRRAGLCTGATALRHSSCSGAAVYRSAAARSTRTARGYDVRMAQEIEVKVRLADPAALRARLAELGAVGQDRTFEFNRI